MSTKLGPRAAPYRSPSQPPPLDAVEWVGYSGEAPEGFEPTREAFQRGQLRTPRPAARPPTPLAWYGPDGRLNPPRRPPAPTDDDWGRDLTPTIIVPPLPRTARWWRRSAIDLGIDAARIVLLVATAYGFLELWAVWTRH